MIQLGGIQQFEILCIFIFDSVYFNVMTANISAFKLFCQRVNNL